MNRSRLLIPLAAALAVLVLTGGIWWATAGSGDEGSEAQPGAGIPAGEEPPGDKPSGGGSSGNVGSGTTTDPGSGTPVEPAPTQDPAPDSVPIDSFYQRGPRTLGLNYAIGVPECYGTVTGVEVHETPRAVVLTLVRTPAEPSADACIDIAMLETIDVQLDEPLGDRAVKDGAYEDKVVEEADATYEDGGY